MQTQTYQELVEQKKDSSPGGADAVFIPISDKWALKMFHCEYKRDFSYEIQQKCSEHGLAPKVGEKVDIEDDEYCYGFICEIVETVVPEDLIMKVKRANESGEGWSYELDNEWGEYEYDSELQTELSELNQKYDNLGFYPSDMHVGNLGYMYDEDGERRLVCIDFGHWS